MNNFFKKGKSKIIKSPFETFWMLNVLYFLRDVVWSGRYFLIHIFPKRKYLIDLKKIKNSKKGKCAFVFANGPSLSKLSFEKILKYQKKGFDIIAVNSFISKQTKLIPNYYVLSDPAYFMRDTISNELRGRVEKDLELINENNVTCFIPFDFEAIGVLNKFHYFNDAECLSLGNFSNPLFPRSFISMTAYKALLISIHLGYDEIYISGFDNDYFLGLRNNAENCAMITERHFYALDGKLLGRDIKKIGFGSLKEVLLDSYWLFYFLSKFNKFNIINLDKEGLCDEFTKKHFLDVYSE